MSEFATLSQTQALSEDGSDTIESSMLAYLRRKGANSLDSMRAVPIVQLPALSPVYPFMTEVLSRA